MNIFSFQYLLLETTDFLQWFVLSLVLLHEIIVYIDTLRLNKTAAYSQM